MKYTDGPWVATGWCRTIVNGPDGATITAYPGAHLSVAEVQANARLIAAAPELLEALHVALNVEGPALVGAQFGAWAELDVQYHFRRIRAAIAKATGE